MRFAVLISGHGSNLQSIIDACKRGTIKSELALVISDKPKAFGLERAQRARIPTKVFNPKDYTNRQSVDRDMIIHLTKEKIDFVVLAGYMRLLTPYFIKKYHRKILNVHPSLLPSFRGVQGIKDTFTYGSKVTGVTIHFVDEKMDHGPIIAQDSFKIYERDTLESLERRIHKLEHKIYSQAIAAFEQGRLKIKGRKVHVVDKPSKMPSSR